MPAVREKLGLSSVDGQKLSQPRSNRPHPPTFIDTSPDYPTEQARRATFRTKQGKLTAFQWAVYDFTRKVPCGRVTTYKDVCTAIGRGSPRSVGAALRNNPFAPSVPCHRVIASNCYVGGFLGEWGASRCSAKIHMLTNEGVEFTTDGYLANKGVVWRG
ncbi:6-O-methylguanine DNA methyltransferase [Pisolithus tinctorius]|nr:6-O-methylguanine DNA methyltransferase [Pisolithus tinctorius]